MESKRIYHLSTSLEDLREEESLVELRGFDLVLLSSSFGGAGAASSGNGRAWTGTRTIETMRQQKI